jgi:uncharacterized protein YbaR (Trm112 family)
VDTRLLDILVCPICKHALEHDRQAQELICRPDKLAYPVRDGIPIMWPDQARDLNAAPLAAVEPVFPAPPEAPAFPVAPDAPAPAAPKAGDPAP